MLRLMFLFIFGVSLHGINAVPVVIKESSPNGESIIAISSSNPEVEKYILDYAAERAKLNAAPSAEARASSLGHVVRSFSVATPERTIAGSGRSFGDDFSDPFFSPYFIATDLDGFDVRNWLRSVESFYDPSFAGGGTSVSATAVSNNGQAYGKVETHNLNNRGHK